MKKFIVVFTKVIPWVFIIAGIIMILANPPRRAHGYDEDPVAAILMLLGVIVSSLLFFAFSYVVEAACLFLEKSKKEETD